MSYTMKALCLLGVVLALSMDSASAIPGRTTRYWDCCKPSCGWASNVNGQTFARSCDLNGVSHIDGNEQSVCNGGRSTTCVNNQPIVINDQLAYGFAAFSERGSCCKCYQLTFTSGPVAGKRMIVQATNTGGDVGVGHFDLLMPGGGVGIFNGCKRQWNSPEDGWGSRFGGIHHRGECNQLPAQLQPGCYWRFDWFRGADNPNIDYHQVACPHQLLDISHCRV